MRLIVRPAAAADIEDAHRWYCEKRSGLGAESVAAVRDAGSRLSESPEAYPILHREARRTRLKRFPYSLVYRVYPECIVIVACLHGRRDPRKWRAR